VDHSEEFSVSLVTARVSLCCADANCANGFIGDYFGLAISKDKVFALRLPGRPSMRSANSRECPFRLVAD
jgi:hypothetical protein